MAVIIVQPPTSFQFVYCLNSRFVAKTYSSKHGEMANERRRKCDYFETFADGITNGAKWYPVCGGMQDFNYLFTNCFEITIELGCNKFPKGRELLNYWNENKASIYDYIWLVSVCVCVCVGKSHSLNELIRKIYYLRLIWV